MRRIVYLVVSLCALAALVAPTAVAAQRMWIGFHDDASFRGAADRAERVQASANLGASMMRLYVQWEVAAPTRPTNPTDPLDPAYNLADVDEAVRNAQASGLQVMITLSGTPRWANGGKRANTMPTRLSDFRDFARAMASRYSGNETDLPFVRFWTIWNEPNLQTFLSPQFKGRKSIAPANYAKLAAAGYAGIKAGSPRAKVAIGETSARGRDRRIPGVSDTHTPGTFARARREGEQAAEVRRVGAPSVPVEPEDEAVAEDGMAERLADVAAEVQQEPADVVQAEGPDLGHRVRAPDEATGPVRGSVQDPGRVHQAVDRDREEVLVRPDVRLVRVPGRSRAAVGVRPLHGLGRCQGRLARRVQVGRSRARCAGRRCQADPQNNALTLRIVWDQADAA